MKKIFALLTALMLAPAWAGGFNPTQQPIEIVVPYPAGGATDRVGRVISEIFTAHGWKSVVVNRPGADTVIGSNYVAKAPATGHTLYIGGNGFIDANIAFKNQAPGIEYTENSFTPIVPLGTGNLVLAVPAESPVSTYEEYKAWVKRNPEKFSVGFWNSYTANIFYEWARSEGLPRPTIIPYKGSAPQIQDLLGNNIPAVFDTFTATRQHYESGKIKILATLSSEGARSVAATGARTQATVLSRGNALMDVPIWYGLFGPAGMDPAVVAEINRVVNSGLARHSETFATASIIAPGGTAQDLDRRQKSILKNMRQISKNIE